jgi:hypothetical protein
MKEDDLLVRVERFERTVATCLCALPTLFSAQCLLAALAAPVFRSMFIDFGAKLPALTQFVISVWPVFAVIALAVPIAALLIARKGRASLSVVFSTVAGISIFVIAQFVTLSLFLPIFELGAVAGGAK